MASIMELQVDGTSATLVNFLSSDRRPLEIPAADVLSDYEDRDFNALAQSNLPAALKNTLHKTALSFKTPPVNMITQHPNAIDHANLQQQQQPPTPSVDSRNPDMGHVMPPPQPPQIHQLQQNAPPMIASPPNVMQPQSTGNPAAQSMHNAGAVMKSQMLVPQAHLPQPSLMPNMQNPMPQARPSVTVPVVTRDVTMVAPVSPMPPCQWFSPTAIHELEVSELRCSFPDLVATTAVDFSAQGSSMSNANLTNALYLQLRNTLIDVYRANPGTKLTFAECRKHCDGDLATLIRVLSFLERHRLVNYALSNNAAQAGGSLTNNNILDPATKKLKEELSNHWTTTPTCSSCDRICLYSFYVLSPSIYGSCLPYSTLRTAVWCHDCVKEIPQNQCLLKVNLPALHIPGGTASWSEQQICALFDAIESLGPDWVAVSKAVSSVQGNPIRTPRECLAAFLSMPLSEQGPNIEKKDGGINNQEVKNQQERIVPTTETEKFALDLLLTAMDILQQRTGELPPIASAISTVASTRMAEITPPDNGHQADNHNAAAAAAANAMDSLLANSR